MIDRPDAQRDGLWIKRMEVRRTPGIREPYVLDDLSTGITILYGPNGCGKTSTARSLMTLLWPESGGDSYELVGEIEATGATWRVEHDRFRTTYQRDGLDAGALPIGAIPAETRDRYLLTLYDLIGSHGDAFARTIQRESAGGYDIDGAAEQLGYRKPLAGRQIKKREVDEARRQLRQAEQAGELIKRREDSLTDWRRRLQQAHQARAEAHRLQAAIKSAEAARQVEQAQGEVDAFPKQLFLLAGNELDLLASMGERRQALLARRQAEQRTIASTEAELEASGLAGMQADPSLLPQLQHERETLLRLDERIIDLQSRLAGSEQHRGDARARIDQSISDEQLTTLDDAGSLQAFVRLSRRLELASLQREAMRQQEQWLGTIAQPNELPVLVSASDRLWRIRGLLLADNPRAAAVLHERLLWVSLVVCIFVIALASFVTDWRLGVLAIVPVAIAIVAILRRGSKSTTDVASLIADFSRFGVAVPTDWSLAAVDAALTSLTAELRRAEVEQEKWHRWQNLAAERAEISAVVADLQQEQASCIDRFGVELKLDAEYLRAVVDTILAWRVADSEVQGIRGELATLRSDRETALDRFNARVAPVLGHQAATASEVTGHLDVLRQQIEAHAAAASKHAHAEQMITAEIDPAIVGIGLERDRIYAKLELAPDDDDTLLERLVARRPEFEAANQRLQETRFAFNQAIVESNHDAGLRFLPPAELQARLDQALHESAELNAISDEITSIEAIVREAKTKRDVEQTLATLDHARQSMRQIRDQDYRLAIGQTLVSYVAEHTRDVSRPPVFHRARALLARFTHGRYRLEAGATSPYEFFAVDTVEGRGRGLEELSSGTRVQLLMAIRLAFVETLETGPKLPLIIDEALGNTDDARAVAIIETAAELCQDGRQLFYLTAQQVEVERWHAVLGHEPSVPIRVIDLAEVRGQAAVQQQTPLRLIVSRNAELLDLGGRSRDDVRRLLNVGQVNPWAPDLGHVHVWYLVPDLEQLQQLIALRIRTWGEWQNLQVHNRDRLSTLLSDTTFPHAAARSRVLAALTRYWKSGRGKPVDADVLAASNLVSEVFIEELSRKVDAAGGDARYLVSILRNREVKSFRVERIDELEAYFYEHGYLSGSRSLSDEQIVAHVLTAVAADLATGMLCHAEVESLLREFGSPAMEH